MRYIIFFGFFCLLLSCTSSMKGYVYQNSRKIGNLQKMLRLVKKEDSSLESFFFFRCRLYEICLFFRGF